MYILLGFFPPVIQHRFAKCWIIMDSFLMDYAPWAWVGIVGNIHSYFFQVYNKRFLSSILIATFGFLLVLAD